MRRVPAVAAAALAAASVWIVPAGGAAGGLAPSAAAGRAIVPPIAPHPTPHRTLTPRQPVLPRTMPGGALGLDPAVRTGVLPNGLRFFIRHNEKPEKRLALRLAVNVGSLAEADDQRGLAHLTEHMEFNGSKHFKADELVAYLESIGLRFGADANAYTSFDETVYMLELPTDRDTLLSRGLDVLSDWAGGATLSDPEIAKERGVVLEEWRLGRGASERMMRKWFPVYFHGSKYADRLPIGLPEIIEHAPAARLRDFYHDWYTPDHMAVIAVGDIDPARFETLIREHFGAIPRAAHPRPSPRITVPPHDSTLVAIATDPEATSTVVQLAYQRPRTPHLSEADYRRDLVEDLAVGMLNARLDERARTPGSPLLFARASGQSVGRTTEAFTVHAATPDSALESGLAVVTTELARAGQHGFLATELDRSRRSTLAASDRSYAERNKTSSTAFVQELLDYWLTGDADPGIEKEHTLTAALVPGISLEEVNAALRGLTRHASRVVVVTAPAKAESKMPSGERLAALVDQSGGTPVSAWVDTLGTRPLMPPLQSPGSITGRRAIPEIGVTVLSLSNGVEVWLKPTDFKADQILFSAVALGGATAADTAQYLTASASDALVAYSGLGGYSAVELGKLLAGRVASASTSVEDYTRRLGGSCRPQDLETALQLAYLAFTRPTESPEGLRTLQQRYRAALADRANSPEAVFQDSLTAVTTSGFYADRPRTVPEVDALQLAPMLSWYRQAFANADEFRFYFVGNFDVDSAGPQIARYLGALPAHGPGHPAGLDRVATFPAGIRRVRVVKGVEPKAHATITFRADARGDELEMHRARAAASILEDHLRQVLREDLGQTYGASVFYNHVLPARGYETMTIDFGGAPANIDHMIEVTLKEVARLREEGPSKPDVARDQEIERRELETSIRENPTWNALLVNYNLFGFDPKRIARRGERIENLTPERLHETFRTHFPLDRYTVVTLMPENAGGATSPGTHPRGER